MLPKPTILKIPDASFPVGEVDPTACAGFTSSTKSCPTSFHCTPYQGVCYDTSYAQCGNGLVGGLATTGMICYIVLGVVICT